MIMDTRTYEQKVLEILEDTRTYVKYTLGNHKNVLTTKLVKLCETYKRELTDRERNAISITTHCGESYFNGIPKIHKSVTLKERIERNEQPQLLAPDITDYPLRPIIAGPSYPTQQLSRMMDAVLKPFTTKVKSYVRDDIHFLSLLKRDTTPNTILTTFDIKNLYSEIPHDLGLTAIEYWMEKHPELLITRLSKNFVLESIKIILENNFFKFGEDIYLQNKGTAMGTKCAPVYATLTIGYLEENVLYDQVKRNISDITGQYVLENWRRYLDDCYISWPFGLESLREFHNILNNLHPNIEFTINYSDTEIPFLDILLNNSELKITTDIYRKETDSQDYLSFHSCHPRHTKLNIPYNLARRIRTIVDDQNIEQKRLDELIPVLQSRGYPLDIIHRGIQKAREIPKESLRTNHPSRPREQNENIPLVTTHNPNNTSVIQTARNIIQMMNVDNQLRNIFGGKTILNSKRQPKNLQRHLCHNYGNAKSGEIKKCGEPRCGTCKYLYEGSRYKFQNQNEDFIINNEMNCKTRNVIYAIICAGCGQEYIGQTSTPLRMRVNVHNQQIRDPSTRQLGVSDHLDRCAVHRRLDPPYKILPFYRCTGDIRGILQSKEQFFIKKYKPKLNNIRR